MPDSSIPLLLKRYGLRDTQPRRLVAESLIAGKEPSSAYDLRDRIVAGGGSINQVTVYRVLEAFERLGIAHRHPCNGRYTLCTMPERGGHHGILHCRDCGATEEFVDAELCRSEERVARDAGFRPASHVSELLGTCAACSRS